jgi:hypothetical protein
MPTESLSQRHPPAVLAATACIALDFGIGLYKWAFTAKWHKPMVPVVYLGFAILFFLFVRALFRGRHWAREVTVKLGGINFLYYPFVWHRLHVDSLFVVQLVLQAVAIILLLLPSARDWFAPPRKGGAAP